MESKERKKVAREVRSKKFILTPEGVQEVNLTEEEIAQEREAIKDESRSDRDEAIRRVQDNIFEVIF